MESTIQIRQATVEDAAVIADMSRRTFYDSFAAQNTPEDIAQYMETQFTRESLMAEVGRPGNIFLLAYLGTNPVGYARLLEHEAPPEMGQGPAIELVRLYAEQSAIGKGVGSALMQSAVDLGRGKGKKWLWLGVWEHNHRAIAFYTKWGFEKFGDHPFILGSDTQTDWWMRKPL
ncbi:GNAT family N-acetyltransferase [Flavitalea sp. BT771]|uniref:GNAT family N-acetyltransferase n=1 Tax=Flavitalea sp. BT771 TaxID=3063329 RepID=UPI0026E2D01D|nr:GNAT family N-acetyltransferase [Flavitalea sp. BT771]MDO6434651.1 GNAT family N-acetyltransferase [Flavitalea sp. BT771]MDV6223551.1 GNAT family N-acetyltransferase [Flavitalea sp. BT771]